MRTKKRRLKAIPKIVASERQTALNAGKLLAGGFDPLEVTESSGGGTFRYRVKDIATFFEITGKKFDVVHTNFKMVDEDGTYVRRLKED